MEDQTLRELIEFHIGQKAESAIKARSSAIDALTGEFYLGQVAAFTEVLSLLKNIK